MRHRLLASLHQRMTRRSIKVMDDGADHALLLLQRHEDSWRLNDVEQTLVDAGLPAHESYVTLGCDVSSVGPSARELSDALLSISACRYPSDTLSTGGCIQNIWLQCMITYCARMAPMPSECANVLDALSTTIYHHWQRDSRQPRDERGTQAYVWMHLVTLKVLHTMLRMAAPSASASQHVVEKQDVWIAAIKRQQDMFACLGGAAAATERSALLLRQYSFFKATGPAIASTDLSQLLICGAAPFLPRRTGNVSVDAAISEGWQVILPWLETDFVAFATRRASVWANTDKDTTAHLPLEEVTAINAQLSSIGRGSSPSTVV